MAAASSYQPYTRPSKNMDKAWHKRHRLEKKRFLLEEKKARKPEAKTMALVRTREFVRFKIFEYLPDLKNISNMIGARIIKKEQVTSVICAEREIKHIVMLPCVRSLTIVLSGAARDADVFQSAMHNLVTEMLKCRVTLKELTIKLAANDAYYTYIDLGYMRIEQFQLTKLHLADGIGLYNYFMVDDDSDDGNMNLYESEELKYCTAPIAHIPTLKQLRVEAQEIDVKMISHMQFDKLWLRRNDRAEILAAFKDKAPIELVARGEMTKEEKLECYGEEEEDSE